MRDPQTYRRALEQQIAACRRCPYGEQRESRNGKAVPGEGPVPCPVVFVGEGPGEEEEKQGRPFVGRAGRLLESLLNSINVDRERVYITNVVKCRPPGNEKPTRQSMEACVPYLHAQLALLEPRIIVLLGATAVEGVLGRTVARKLGAEMWGKVMQKEGLIFLVTYHPAYVLRNPRAEPAIRSHFEQLERFLRHLAPEVLRRRVQA